MDSFLDNKFHIFASRSSIIVIVAAHAPMPVRDKDLDKDYTVTGISSLAAISSVILPRTDGAILGIAD